ncbi:MAG: GCN5-related N-acetyltransferase [Pedosphaera sp.]|nr:GCN5-related N-acetyltransferase [Pedosphaera sp.]
MKRSPRFTFQSAGTNEAATLAILHNTVAEHLTSLHGHGPWSSKTSEKGLLSAMRTSSVFVALIDDEIVGTLHLTTKKPWAIDTSYFAPARAPLYLIAMAITPASQRQGIGRKCLVEAARTAKNWPADAIRLDAFDAEAGAGPFYERCGCTEVGRATYRGAPLIYYEMILK